MESVKFEKLMKEANINKVDLKDTVKPEFRSLLNNKTIQLERRFYNEEPFNIECYKIEDSTFHRTSMLGQSHPGVIDASVVAHRNVKFIEAKDLSTSLEKNIDVLNSEVRGMTAKYVDQCLGTPIIDAKHIDKIIEDDIREDEITSENNKSLLGIVTALDRYINEFMYANKGTNNKSKYLGMCGMLKDYLSDNQWCLYVGVDWFFNQYDSYTDYEKEVILDGIRKYCANKMQYINDGLERLNNLNNYNHIAWLSDIDGIDTDIILEKLRDVSNNLDIVIGEKELIEYVSAEKENNKIDL